MFDKYRTISATIVALALVFAGVATAQNPQPGAAPPPPNNYSEWIKGEVGKAIAARALIAENGNGTANQKESPSTDIASTSLVDTSSASDFASLALNLTGLRLGDETSKPASGRVTVTLYSLVAAAKGIALTDPAFYREGTRWRRLSLTLGSEESKLADHATDKPATTVGAKFLILNDRDVYSVNGQKQLDER